MSSTYIHQLPQWPDFQWDYPETYWLVANVRHHQGRLLGRMESLGSNLQNEATLQNITLDVLKSSEIEGEFLNPQQVRSSVARRLGLNIAGLIPSDRDVEGIVEMMLDATQRCNEPLTAERLFQWHASLFPEKTGHNYKMIVGGWRQNPKHQPMQVVSGPFGREEVHFQAPDSDKLDVEMQKFLDWFNDNDEMLDPIVKAAVAHFWFVTIHPFGDGNGRIARAITDMLLARADGTPHRFYSMSSQIRIDREDYYKILEKTGKETHDITAWLAWFLQCLNRSLSATDATLLLVLKKNRFWNNPVVQSLNERQKYMLNKLLEGFEGKLNSSKWAKMAKCSQDSAIRDIQDLLDKKILEKEAAGGRSTSYILLEPPGHV